MSTKGRIYKLYNEKLDLSYIGKTQQNLKLRLAQHKHAVNKKLIGKNNEVLHQATSTKLFVDGKVKIELLEEIDINSYEDKIKLTNLEKHYILNLKCVNKCLPFASTIPYSEDRKEYFRQYSQYHYRKNKEHILNYQKEYKIKNLDKIKNYQKSYRNFLKMKGSKL
jgi:muramoyltetrapeptide carboxypeptidase LdcA involved in peptidoglycan recycling